MPWLDNQQRREKWMAFVRTLNPDIDPRAVRLMENMFSVSRLIHHRGESGLNEVGMSLAQYRILMHLFFAENMGERSELNPSEISERQGVSRNTISSLIRSLEDDGLITRSLDQQDRRKFNISLTDNGRSLVSQYARGHLSRVSQCFGGLTETEQETLSQLLTKISVHVTAVRQNQQT
jgi:DNA-binding MarR family transcriptional regulator